MLNSVSKQFVLHQQYFNFLLALFRKKDILSFHEIVHNTKLSSYQIRELLSVLGEMNKVVHDEVRDLYYLL